MDANKIIFLLLIYFLIYVLFWGGIIFGLIFLVYEIAKHVPDIIAGLMHLREVIQAKP